MPVVTAKNFKTCHVKICNGNLTTGHEVNFWHLKHSCCLLPYGNALFLTNFRTAASKKTRLKSSRMLNKAQVCCCLCKKTLLPRDCLLSQCDSSVNDKRTCCSTRERAQRWIFLVIKGRRKKKKEKKKERAKNSLRAPYVLKGKCCSIHTSCFRITFQCPSGGVVQQSPNVLFRLDWIKDVW